MISRTVTLCGSSRFMAGFAEANRELTLRGHVVIPMGIAAGTEADNRGWEAHAKEKLDLVHLRKIALSDAILVVGDGYIGFSTAREILWADMLGKEIYATAHFENPFAPGRPFAPSYTNPAATPAERWDRLALAIGRDARSHQIEAAIVSTAEDRLAELAANAERPSGMLVSDSPIRFEPLPATET